MTKMVNETHLRQKIVDEQGNATYRQFRVCQTRTGFPDCCKRSNRKSDLDSYGVGTVLYF